jgi:hypothetical protein
MERPTDKRLQRLVGERQAGLVSRVHGVQEVKVGAWEGIK